MIKTVSFKCAGCGAVHTFTIGAGQSLTTLKDALTRIPGKKDTDEILKYYMKISERKTALQMNEFASNPADALENIAYDVCSEETVGMFGPEEEEAAKAYFTDKHKEAFAASIKKWDAAFAKMGIVAFTAIYMCPKTRHPQQGLYLSMHWAEDKKEKYYRYRNICNECGTPLVLVDDRNVGFMHEGLDTILRCNKCNGTLSVARVDFRIAPQPAAHAAAPGATPVPGAAPAPGATPTHAE